MKRVTKKDVALSLRAAGRSVEEIAVALNCTPSYVANVLIASGKTSDYSDLYTSSVAQNAYARMFSGVLRFKTVEAARESVLKIDSLFHEFERENDRRGQHQAQLMALIGKNRAEGIGKTLEANVFREWLVSHLDISYAPACDKEPTLDLSDAGGTPDYGQMSPYEATLAFA